MDQARPLVCPSAQPGMTGLRLLGVIESTEDGLRIAYLNEDVPVTDELFSQIGSFPPTRIFRFAAKCAERRCAHFDGRRCNLVTRVVNILPAVVDSPALCLVRSKWRWHEQEGLSVCSMPSGSHSFEQPHGRFQACSVSRSSAICEGPNAWPRFQDDPALIKPTDVIQ